MTLTRWMKEAVAYSPLFEVTAALTRTLPRILMYHRFSACAADDPYKVGADAFEWQLQRLSRGWKVLTLAEFVSACNSGEAVKKCVVITVDDGYRDFYLHAYPLLKRYGIPATFYVTTGFLDGEWLWWDRVAYALDHAQIPARTISVGDTVLPLELEDRAGRLRSKKNLSDFLIRLPNEIKWQFIHCLESELGVILPSQPTPDYAPVTWDELREMLCDDIEVGAHTVTHPILSKLDDTALEQEISLSRSRLEKELGRPPRSFCYPNGTPEDIDERMAGILRKIGFTNAVMSCFIRGGAGGVYRLPRFDVGSDRLNFLRKLSGFEALSRGWRGGQLSYRGSVP